jgi:hypothetical protein
MATGTMQRYTQLVRAPCRANLRTAELLASECKALTEAARSYAEVPNAKNFERLEAAISQVRHLHAVTQWRLPRIEVRPG